MRSAHPEKPCMERTPGQGRSKSQHKFKQENCSGKEVEVKYVLVTQPRGFLTRKYCRILLLSKLLAKQDDDLNWRSILKAHYYILLTFLNPATCSYSVKNWEGVVKLQTIWSQKNSLHERPLWGLEGKHPWRNPVSTRWEKVFPCTHPYTHSHSLPKFLQPNWAASYPQPLLLTLCIKTKTKTKNSSRAEPPTLYKIVAILSTWAWQPTPQDSPIYISWRSKQVLLRFCELKPWESLLPSHL